LITSLVVRAFDLRQGLIDRWQVYVRRLHKRVLRETQGERTEAAPGRLAIVALYPSDDSLPFTLNLLDALAVAGFWILVVSTRRLSTEQLAPMKARAHHIIERAPVGRDFGSYKMGLEWLERHRQLSSAETLVLANDSMFYPKAFAGELENMLQCPNDWQSLFENYEHHYHAQSFFLLFRAAVLRSDAFRDFWVRYIPYSARVHAIHRGEGWLTECLMHAGFVCEVAYSALRLRQALGDQPAPMLELAELAPAHEQWDVSARIMLESVIEFESGVPLRSRSPELPAGAADVRPHGGQLASRPSARQQRTEAALSKLWATRIARQYEIRNPTHFGALFCNRLFTAPIKRDICYRGIFDINQVLRAARGFSDDELTAMHRDLRVRGLGWLGSMVLRILISRGRR
jgi:hypothetical protein